MGKGRAILGTVLIFLLALPLLGLHAQAGAPDPQRAGQLEDLRTLRRDFLDVDRSYSPSARKEAERRVAKLEQGDQAIDALTFAVEICRIAALADNVHTQCLRRSESQVPVDFRPLSGSFYVTGASKDYPELLGARLVSVDGRPVKAILAIGRSMRGGPDAWRDYGVAALLRSPPELHVLGLAASADSARYAFLLGDGQSAERMLKAYSFLEAPPLVRLAADKPQPWVSQEPNEPFRMRDAPELDALVVQLRQTSDNGSNRVVDFLHRAEASRSELGRANVVLDMRANGGGDLLLVRDFMIAWPARVPGRIFVLQGTRTGSAAISSIGYLKQSGGEKVILVGGPPGDRLMFFAEGKMIVLRHSTIALLPATERHDYRNGCRTFTDCTASVAQPGGPTAASNATVMASGRIPISVKSLDPDIEAEPTIEDLIAGRDRGMEAVADYLRKGRKG